MSEYEKELAIYEAEMVASVDSFFDARPSLLRNRTYEYLVENGFRLGWKAKQKEQKEVQKEVQKSREELEEELADWQKLFTVNGLIEFVEENFPGEMSKRLREDGDWIPFEATEDSRCPVDPHVKVIMKRRNGEISNVEYAGDWNWQAMEFLPNISIVAYKVVG